MQRSRAEYARERLHDFISDPQDEYHPFARGMVDRLVERFENRDRATSLAKHINGALDALVRECRARADLHTVDECQMIARTMVEDAYRWGAEATRAHPATPAAE